MKIKQLTLSILSISFASSALAGGFALSDQSVSAMGTANAGRASNAQDASVVFNNPAAMHLLKQAQFTQAVAFIDAKTKIKNVGDVGLGEGGLPGGSNDGDIVPHTFIPSGYFTSGNKGGWAWGIAAYGSFGLKTNHEATFAGRYLGDKSDVKVTTIQPAMSYKVNEKVSVGFGPTINKVEAYLSKDTTAAAFGVVELEGDDLGYGFNVGTHLQITPSTQAAVVYRSKVSYKIDDGTLKASAGAPGTYSASTSLDTPESVELSLSHKLSGKTSIHAASTWTRWSRLQDLTVASSGPGPLANTVELFHWKDSMAYAVGVTHQHCDKLLLRAGLAYDNSPVSPAERSVRLPSGDRRVASIGAGYNLSPTQTIDASYTYVDEETAEVRRPAGGGFPGYNADFHNRASVYGLQFTQKF